MSPEAYKQITGQIKPKEHDLVKEGEARQKVQARVDWVSNEQTQEFLLCLRETKKLVLIEAQTLALMNSANQASIKLIEAATLDRVANLLIKQKYENPAE